MSRNTDKPDEQQGAPSPATQKPEKADAAATTVAPIGEVQAVDHFQAFVAPEPVTFASSYRYLGPGFISGVPKDDLDAVTVQRLPSDLHREVAGSPFYEAVKE